MPDETRAIEPALTPNEWAERMTFDAGHESFALVNGRAVSIVTVGMTARRLSRDEVLCKGGATFERPHSLMALANAALPDDDPRKITREDLQALADVLRHIDEQTFEWLVQYSEDARRLAAKLAALLPPEG